MKVSTAFRLGMALLVACGLALVERTARPLLESRQRIENGARAATVLRPILEAQFRFSAERGPVNRVLGSDLPLPAALVTGLEAARTTTNEAWRKARDQVAANPAFDSGTGATEALDGAMNKLTNGRLKVNALAEVALINRSDTGIRAAVNAMIEAIPLFAPAMTAAEKVVTRADPSVVNLVAIARLSAEMRDYAGQLGSMFTSPIVTKRPLTRDELARIEYLQGSVNAVYYQLRLAYDKADVPEEVRVALRRVELEYIGLAHNWIRVLISVGLESGNYNVSTTEFADRYVPQMNSILGLRDAALNGVDARLAHIAAENGRQLTWAFVFAAVMLTVMAVFYFFIRTRLTQPVARVNRALHQLAAGEDNVDLPDSRRRDEIGEVVESLRRLAVVVGERKAAAEAIIRARMAAEEASMAKSQFLANMSHEIRTPMNAITGMCYLAQRTPLNERQRRYLQSIDVAARTLLDLINDVLDLSKIEAGKLRIEAADFSLDDVIDRVIKIHSLRAEEKAIELAVVVGQGVPRRLVGDSVRLGQVCNNLVGNAIKFTEKGDVKLRIDVESLQDGRARLIFEISDSGIGIDKAVLPRLFQPFEQADASTTRRFGGTGLGLNICKRLVEAMGGQIGVESEPGVGSIFWFRIEFPVQAAQLDTRAPADAKKLRVLVVDDSPSAQEALQEMLESQTYAVDIVGSGELALIAVSAAVADGRPYDLVLMDWRMPGLDGIETTRRIRSDNAVGDTPIIIMVSAFGSEEVRSQADRVGMDDFLVKPVTGATLHNAIVSAFKRMPQRAAALPVDDSHSIAGLRVLVAEDSDINREIVAEMLRSEGVDFVLAEDGQAALDRLAETSFDVLLTDLEMPRLDGLAAIRRVRAQSRWQALPIIVMTAGDVVNEIAHYRSEGASDAIAKPIAPEQLFAKLRQWDLRVKDDSSAPDFAGARVLVADDVAANRELLRELLLDCGAEVSEVVDGQQAVDRVLAEVFDAVLMDIQMPLLDGLEATRRIRQHPERAAVPIIAVTAHAMLGDRDKCLAAGMNEYIAKPVEPRALYAALRKLLPQRAPGAAPRRENPALAQDAQVPLPPDSAHLAVTQALQNVMGKRSLLRKLLLRFLSDHAGDQPALDAARREQDAPTLSRLAHTLAGVAGGIGAQALFTRSRALELAADQGDWPTCDAQLGQIGAELASVVGILSAYRDATGGDPLSAKIPDAVPGVAVHLLAALAQRLDQGSSRTQKYFALLDSPLLGAGGEAERAEIRAAMKAFDFDAALARLTDYAGQLGLTLAVAAGEIPEKLLRQAEQELEQGAPERAGQTLLEGLST